MKEALKKVIFRTFLFIDRCIRVAFLPILLAILLVLQNAAFIAWLRIVPELYVRMYAATFALGVLVYGPAIFLRAHKRYIYLLITSTIAAILLVTEYLFYSYSQGFFQISALRLLGQSDAFIGTAIRLITPKLLLFLLGPLLVIAAHVRAWRYKVFPTMLPVMEKVCIFFFIITSVLG
jgi:hypothetical protein